MKKIILSLTFLALFPIICTAPVIMIDIEALEGINKAIEEETMRAERERQISLFIEHLAHKESSGKWDTINIIGCIGKFQFAPITLKQLGYEHITPKAFRQDPNIFPEDLQYQLLLTLLKLNEKILQKEMEYIGQEIGGVIITKSGLLAAAHLGGCGSVALFIRSGGKINKRDILGTSISDYMKEFSNYNF